MSSTIIQTTTTATTIEAELDCPTCVAEELATMPWILPAARRMARQIASGELSPGAWLTSPESW